VPALPASSRYADSSRAGAEPPGRAGGCRIVERVGDQRAARGGDICEQ